MYYQVSWDSSYEVVSIIRIEYGYHSLFDYFIFRFLTISMIIQYKPQTITISIKPCRKSPNPRGSHNIQTIDPPIKILCTIVVFRIISRNFILSPFSISIIPIIVNLIDLNLQCLVNDFDAYHNTKTPTIVSSFDSFILEMRV